jgi:hypothetical protein
MRVARPVLPALTRRTLESESHFAASAMASKEPASKRVNRRCGGGQRIDPAHLRRTPEHQDEPN